jgi:hypothetical protein
MNANLSDLELEAISSRAERATPGPWFGHATDDQHSSNALYISTAEGSKEYHDNRNGLAENHPEQTDAATVIAITLLQTPLLCRPKEFEQNTEFIACARSDIPRLVAEVRDLRKRLSKFEIKRSTESD